jgi:ABC-2 type transport system ATP-binding protein
VNNIIEIDNLNKAFGNNLVLNNISLNVLPSQIIGYIGPNGAGKSTTIKILTGLLGDYSGSVKIKGQEVKESPTEVKRIIGYIPENAVVYESLTPIEYLRFLGGLHDIEPGEITKKAESLLQLFGLYPNRDDRMSSFSKGMRQKVLIISGLLHNPDIIFMDEPLSGLDANAVILVKEILQRLRSSGKTLFYSSHIMDVVEKVCDRIVLINKGKIVADGSFEELKEQQQSGSLEQLFNQMTGNNEHIALADDFVNIINS